MAKEKQIPEKTVEDVYKGISDKTGLTPEEVAQIGGVESQHGKYQDNMGGGKATGLLQIMPNLAQRIRPGTTKQELKDYNVQEEIGSDLINANAARIRQIEKEDYRPLIEDIYAFHNLGMGRGKNFIQANDDELVSNILPQDVINSNKKLYDYQTVGEAKKAIKEFLKQRGSQFEFSPQIEDIFKE